MRIAGRSFVLWALLAAACSKQGTGPDAPVIDSSIDGAVVPGNPGDPGLGAHVLSYFKLDQEPAALSISTPSMTTKPSGSMILVTVGRGDNTQFVLPTDSKGNAPYQQVGTMHAYERWEDSGTAVYAFPSIRGGSDFTVTTRRNMPTQPPQRPDEITMAVVEVVDAERIQDYKWNEVQGGNPLTTLSVTTTGPATLVAFWWGDGFPGTPQSATPNNGFTVIDTNAHETNSFVQCVVAVKNVSAAGTYNVTWTPTPEQGAQMWLIAVQ
jgi:hypothetical protein